MERFVVAALILLFGGAAFAESIEDDPRVQLGLVPVDVMRGSRLFFEETFAGNGRTCGTCHVAEDNLQIELATVRALPQDAPFFAKNVPGLEQPGMIQRGLILENVDGFANQPMFRSTPHMLSLSTSIHSNVDVPAGTDTVGWGGDGAPAPGTLRDFARGAVTQHFTRSLARVPGVDFRLPTAGEEEALLAFQMSLGRTADISLANVRFNDPQAERGRSGPQAFLDSVGNNCQRCHGDGGASRGANGGGPEVINGIVTGNQNKDTNIDAMRVPTAPHDDGRGFPGDETFSPPPLIEAADTAPFFHIGSADIDLEGAVRFYTVRGVGGNGPGLFSGAQQAFDEQMTQDIGAVLRSLNASLNAQMAIQRIEAANLIALTFPDHPSIGELLDLAAEEAEDGARVLTSPGASKAKAELSSCASLADRAANKNKPVHHLRMIESARVACETANASLGTGLTMQMGAGNLAMRSASFRPRHDADDDEGPGNGQGGNGNGNGSNRGEGQGNGNGD